MIEVPVLLIAALSLTTSFIGTSQPSTVKSAHPAVTTNAINLPNRVDPVPTIFSQNAHLTPSITKPVNTSTPKKYFLKHKTCHRSYESSTVKAKKNPPTFGEILRNRRKKHHAPYR